jgi:membrane-bound lytic murein transglycosylase D
MNPIRTFPFLVSFFAITTTAFAANPKLPSAGLEERVDFWKKVFTQYGERDVVIHDAFHVNLIYDVAGEFDLNSKMASVRDTLLEIREKIQAQETLGPDAVRIAEAITAQGVPITAGSIDDLMDNIHTQRGIKERFRDGIIRSGRHVDQFRDILRKTGVPEELALLPLVESSFQNVRSRAGAVGMWQFTRGTGRLYMTINNRRDDRLDPVRSAQAAGRLLRDNYNALGEWPLAITAYNHGQAGMLRAQRAHGSDIVTIIKDYKGPVFGYASMNFYAEFLAAIEVYDSYPAYFGELVLDRPNAPSSTVKVAAAKPAPAAKAPATAKAATAAGEKYKVKKGDTLWQVAQRFGTSIRSLMELNNLNESVIYAGQILLVR